MTAVPSSMQVSPVQIQAGPSTKTRLIGVVHLALSALHSVMAIASLQAWPIQGTMQAP
jgi:hypothetical protein